MWKCTFVFVFTIDSPGVYFQIKTAAHVTNSMRSKQNEQDVCNTVEQVQDTHTVNI